jgi:hypothetical protein
MTSKSGKGENRRARRGSKTRDVPASGEIMVVQALRDDILNRTYIVIRFRRLDDTVCERPLIMSDFWSRKNFEDRMIKLEFPLPAKASEIARLHETLLLHTAATAKDPRRTAKATPLQGWNTEGTAFILGSRIYPKAATDVFLPAEGVTYPKIAKAGYFADWHDKVAARLPCSSRMLLAACTPLAAALLRFWGVPLAGCGFTISGPSRHGKTLCLRCALSAMGPPEVEAWNRSRVGVSDRLFGSHGLVLVLDGTEGQRSDGKDTASIVDQATELLATGVPDQVDSRVMKELPKAGVRFSSILLASTEGRLPERRRGLQARLADVPLPSKGFGVIDFPELCDPPVTDVKSAGEWVNATSDLLGQHHGHALPRFLRRLLERRKDLEKVARKLMEEFCKAVPELDNDAWARSLRDNFALLYAGGALACKFGIFPFGPETVLDGLRRCLLDAVAQAGASAEDSGAGVERDARTIQEWLQAHHPGRLKSKCAKLNRAEAEKGAVIRGQDPGGRPVDLVRREALLTLMPDAGRLRAALDLIAKHGGLVAGKGDLTRPQKLADGTQLRFLFFTREFARGKLEVKRA